MLPRFEVSYNLHHAHGVRSHMRTIAAIDEAQARAKIEAQVTRRLAPGERVSVFLVRPAHRQAQGQ